MIEALTGNEPAEELCRRVLCSELAAPEIFDLEALNVLRKLAGTGKLSAPDAKETLHDLAESPIARAPHRSLVQRIWELRHSITPYDAAYVALAEQLNVPLVTCDAKLARSNGHDARIEFYPIS